VKKLPVLHAWSRGITKDIFIFFKLRLQPPLSSWVQYRSPKLVNCTALAPPCHQKHPEPPPRCCVIVNCHLLGLCIAESRYSELNGLTCNQATEFPSIHSPASSSPPFTHSLSLSLLFLFLFLFLFLCTCFCSCPDRGNQTDP